MKKKGLVMVLVVLLVAVSMVAEAGSTLEAWRLAGERNGYEAGYADAYYGYSPADLRRFAPEYRDGYLNGYRRGCEDRVYASSYRRDNERGRGYGQSSSFHWGFSIRGRNGSIRVGGRN